MFLATLFGVALASGCFHMREPAHLGGLADHIVERAGITNRSVWNPSIPPVFTRPLSTPPRVKVYGVVDSRRQELAVLAAREWLVDNRDVKEVLILFYERENWQEWSNPQKQTSGGYRGPERLLRKVRVRATPHAASTFN